MSLRQPHVAYFCMEYGLHESFPIYSGGLGILAGDFIKSAHDLKLPMVAVGLLWARGYCVQRIGADGRPYEEYPGYTADWLQERLALALQRTGTGHAAGAGRSEDDATDVLRMTASDRGP